MATTYVPLATQTLVSNTSTVTFSSIPATYTDLVLIVVAADSAAANNQISFRLNSTATAIYSFTALYGNGTAAGSNREATGAGRTYGTIAWNTATNTTLGTSMSVANFMNYSNSTTNKTVLSRSGNSANGTEAAVALCQLTAAVTSIDLYSANVSRSFLAGSTFNLYGIASAAVGTPKATGGNIITTDGSYWYHAFTASGTFTPSSTLSCDTLVVAGGGAGGGGGGGAGGYRSATGLSIPATTNTVTVGAGGSAQSGAGNGTSGGDSTFSSITSAGGGKGNLTNAALAGGSGGGGGAKNYTSGSDQLGKAGNTPSTTPSQGNSGGDGSPAAGGSAAGGGGGAGGIGGSYQSATLGGVGGIGSNAHASWLGVVGLGVSGYLAGGGGGSCDPGTAAGGAGGGGIGAAGGAGSGVANTGGGGGGIYATYPSGAGGSGLVIVRYAV
jgi:hypothetical protein